MIPAQTLTKNGVCGARRYIVCRFSSTHVWALCILKIPSLVKDASSENNTLAGLMGICSSLSKVALWKSYMKGIIIRLQCLDTLLVKQMHSVFSENSEDAGTGNPDYVC